MKRWLFVLGMTVIQCAAIAAASPISPEDHARLVKAAGAPEPLKPIGAGCDSGRRGIAASYGRGQRTTSSGERFDPRRLTAAHRTLPFGTRLTVTNLKTGKSVIVIVNDRGPFTQRIEIDLSTAAAKAIGLSGIAAVCID